MRVVSLSPKEPQEIIPVSFQFSRLVSAIDGVILSVSVKKGVDANPVGLLLGTAQITGTTVTQLIQLGVDDTAYLIKALISSGDFTYSLAAYLLVRQLK